MTAIRTPRSVWAIILYALGAAYAAIRLIHLGQSLFAYGMVSDHGSALDQFLRFIETLLPAALFLAMGVGLQYLADIRWLLANRRDDGVDDA